MQESSSQAPEIKAQDYVDQMAEILGFQIPPEIRPSVVENFERILEIAQPLLDFELPDDIEPATVFEP